MINFYGGTDAGLVREINQDRYQFSILGETLAYAVLCDGMGGPNGGHVASETATRHVTGVLDRELREDMSESTVKALLQSAVAGANAMVHEAARSTPDLAGMGTTLIIAVFLGGHLYVAYVGDSRVYFVRGETETQLTKDHTVVQMLVDIGEISQQDAQSHPKRHYITRAVGVAASVEVDFLEQPIAPGDLVLLCSDGLYHYLEPGSLPGLLRQCAGRGSADLLLDLAKAGGGADNITAVVAACGSASHREER